ncbi:MAG: FKBP-type peptidyl-prolyl cis-trans isomerase [Burkholderiales bacterium]
MIPVAVRPKILGCLAVLVLGAGCSESLTSPSGNAPFSQTDVRAGTGATAINGSVVTVHYTGWLYSESRPDQKGMQFDSSVGGTAFSFTLGVGAVIGGWDQGVAGMRVGGLRRLVIPPSLAYGASRNGPIPPNASLVFDIELLQVVQ